MTGIPAESLRRLIDSLVNSAVRDEAEELGELQGAARREALIEFAGQHDLDIEDTATLYRVAAGEGVEFRPDSTWHSTDVCTAIETAVRIIDSRPKPPAAPVYEDPF